MQGNLKTGRNKRLIEMLALVWSGQLKRSMKGDLALNQFVQLLLLKGVANVKTEGSKLFNKWKGKQWVAHLDKGTTAWTTRLNIGFQKSGFKVNKKGGATHAKYRCHSQFILILQVPYRLRMSTLYVHTAWKVRKLFHNLQLRHDKLHYRPWCFKVWLWFSGHDLALAYELLNFLQTLPSTIQTWKNVSWSQFCLDKCCP